VGAAYREACLTLGLEVEVSLPGDAEPVRGVAEEVDDEGRLVVRTPSGPRALAAGDVVHVRPA
jgi:BirA family biotin operon repressor/biotin-[acetyl-CoA-carboxylase] ligase